MIDKKTLRIGNIYNRIHGKGWTETVITEEIMGKIFSDSNEYALNDFEPIPLTPQVFEQYGFEYKDMMFGGPESAMQYWRKNWFIIERGGTITLFNDKEVPKQIECKFLHQLQNLFALTGTELILTEK